jgi:ADP-dependent NAD(P)H-hydrate dehydratase
MSEPVEVTPELLRQMPLPFPSSDSDKDERGRVLVVGGSAAVPGAVRLAGEAALRAGAGKLQMATLSSLAAQLGLMVPESRVFALEEQDGEIAPGAVEAIGDFVAKCDALLVGPGMIAKDTASAIAERLLETEGPGFVLDAAAMAGAWARPELVRKHGGRVILTPHAGEMAGLSGRPKEEVAADPLKAAREAAARLQAVVMIKGQLTVIAHPDGRGWRHHGHAVGLATSGSGDVLGGVIAGLLARKTAPEVAAVWGVWLHQQAGQALSQRVGPLGFLARELPCEIPRLLS